MQVVPEHPSSPASTLEHDISLSHLWGLQLHLGLSRHLTDSLSKLINNESVLNLRFDFREIDTRKVIKQGRQLAIVP